MTEWNGSWVTDRLGLRVEAVDEPANTRLLDLVGLAVRRNPKRAHLLVSSMLGKHIPVDPRVAYGAGLLLGARVAALGVVGPGDALVLGFAETATALGGAVADALAAPYLHSTRRSGGVTPLAGFEEAHSHATSHLLVPEDHSLLAVGEALVLVDDEVSTGATVINTIREVHRRFPRSHYVIAALVDMRSASDAMTLAALAEELGVRVDVVSLARGSVTVPEGVLAAGQALVNEVEAARRPMVAAERSATIERVEVAWPSDVRESGRHGVTHNERGSLADQAALIARRVADQLDPDAFLIHVLATEELMYAPLRMSVALADACAAMRPEARVTYSTTTRSPVLAVDAPGYAIRTGFTFPAHDHPADGPGARYAYNLGAPGEQLFDTVVVVTEQAADTAELYAADGLLAQVAQRARQVMLAVLPTYTPAAVAMNRQEV